MALPWWADKAETIRFWSNTRPRPSLRRRLWGWPQLHRWGTAIPSQATGPFLGLQPPPAPLPAGTSRLGCSPSHTTCGLSPEGQSLAEDQGHGAGELSVQCWPCRLRPTGLCAPSSRSAPCQGWAGPGPGPPRTPGPGSPHPTVCLRRGWHPGSATARRWGPGHTPQQGAGVSCEASQ